ncbi:uncharacterized protein LOC126783438 isoform X2 [Argentina anserina]|uniref:uncharacterized protein LOC126783438 isoform X2 n=1 Tax=Argentina anserina TaxID=57926 RepID=UPI002176546D|nr:uncharacterized protein LOC126783438 isoform X2 [Potentilla anserina]
MSSRVVRGRPPARSGLRQRKNDLDLNSAPPGANRNHEGTSAQVLPQAERPSQPPLVIDLEAIDDDVVIASPRAFAEAENRSMRRRCVVDLETEPTRATRQKRRRAEPNRTIINCDYYINLEGNNNSNSKNEQALQPPPLPPPPKEPSFTCPICMSPMVEEMSTKCGHIFCKKCIKAAITAQGKCPTCRRKVTAKELIRVFLPTSS